MTPVNVLIILRCLLGDALRMYLTLLKILVPALIIVKVLEMAGGIEWLGQLLSPVMSVVGLPAVLGVVWAATLMTNLVTGLIVFFEVSGNLSGILWARLIFAVIVIAILARCLPKARGPAEEPGSDGSCLS